MTNEQIAIQIAQGKTPQEIAAAVDEIFEFALGYVVPAEHDAVALELQGKGIIIGVGSQSYNDSICGKKKNSPPN